MATKKKIYIDSSWEQNHEKYPCKKGICEFCGQKDDLKLAFDHVRYICINDSACFLRWKKSYDATKKINY